MQYDQVQLYSLGSDICQHKGAKEPSKPQYSRAFLLQWINAVPKTCPDLEKIRKLELVDIQKSNREAGKKHHYSAASSASCSPPFPHRATLRLECKTSVLADGSNITASWTRQVCHMDMLAVDGCVITSDQLVAYISGCLCSDFLSCGFPLFRAKLALVRSKIPYTYLETSDIILLQLSAMDGEYRTYRRRLGIYRPGVLVKFSPATSNRPATLSAH